MSFNSDQYSSLCMCFPCILMLVPLLFRLFLCESGSLSLTVWRSQNTIIIQLCSWVGFCLTLLVMCCFVFYHWGSAYICRTCCILWLVTLVFFPCFLFYCPIILGLDFIWGWRIWSYFICVSTIRELCILVLRLIF